MLLPEPFGPVITLWVYLEISKFKFSKMYSSALKYLKLIFLSVRAYSLLFAIIKFALYSFV